MASTTYIMYFTGSWQVLAQDASSVVVQNVSMTTSFRMAYKPSATPPDVGFVGHSMRPNNIFSTVTLEDGDYLYVRGQPGDGNNLGYCVFSTDGTPGAGAISA